MIHEKQQEMLKKINEGKISRKTLEQEKVVDNLEMLVTNQKRWNQRNRT